MLRILISIHLMLRFNRSNNRICIVYIFISIHLMLRFNSLKEAVEWLVYPFQYILCCGSTLNMLFSWILRVNFNTSYVAVQPRVRNTPYLIKKISIHLMLRFNFQKMEGFFCYVRISIHLMLRFNLIKISG